VVKAMRKVRTGSVVRTKQDKTAIVEMVWKQRHRLYHKQVRRVARFYVHDPDNQCQLGDLVRIEETRQISKTKHWRLLEILESRQVAEIRPIELEADVAPVLAPSPVVDESSAEEEIAAIEDSIEEAPTGEAEDSLGEEELVEESEGEAGEAPEGVLEEEMAEGSVEEAPADVTDQPTEEQQE